MNAKWLKAQTSAAKRTATALRTLAKSHGVCSEDAGIMLAAARAVDTLAGLRSAEAKQAKRNEDAMAAFYANAEKEARAKIMSDWPLDSVLDKVALIALNKSETYLARAIAEYPERAQRYLINYFDSALDDIVREAASRSWYKKISVTAALCELARQWEVCKQSRPTVALAEAISRTLDQPTAKAA